MMTHEAQKWRRSRDRARHRNPLAARRDPGIRPRTEADVFLPRRAEGRRVLAQWSADRCSLAGLEWSPDHRRSALVRRGLEETAAWGTTHLADLGLGPEAIVDELLAIEVEMWRDVGRRDA